jgi:hypothetical protein
MATENNRGINCPTGCSIFGPHEVSSVRDSDCQTDTRVEAGSNTSTVTLRVVGGDEKGSLKSETIKYGRESQKDCAGKSQQHM